MRKGSALLVVLGMMSFMLFSGVAFSVYMRQTRLPSTFLRRTTVTRQLAKAALAEAIEEIDYAIGSDPHPGVTASTRNNNNNNNSSSSSSGDDGDDGNYWNHRVFVRNSKYANSDAGYADGDTISTLTLEGLAYLPPALINEVRYFSRRTPTAKWQKFRFEAGRYAYCAIDVSDHFDVNRLLADRARSSASSRRITFAHAFEGSGAGGLHGSQNAGKAAEWDEWLEDSVRAVDPDTDEITFPNGKMPLVSLADFNLMMAKNAFGNIKSPFITYLETDGSTFYADATTTETDARAEAYRSMTFVTDSLFRKPTTDEKDLESSDNQPFEASDLKKSARLALSTLQNKINGRQNVTEDYLTILSRIGMATLYDYLDENSRPISLAIPTVERNPMICGIGPEFNNVSFNVTKSGDDKLLGENGGDLTYPETRERTVSQTIVYSIDGGSLGVSLAGGGVIQGLAVYPFLHDEDKRGSWTLDGKMALYLTTGNDRLPMAQSSGNDNFCFGGSGGADPDQNAALDDSTGILSFPLEGSMPVPGSISRQEDAVFTFTAKPTAAARTLNRIFADGGNGRHWISITYKWKQTFQGGKDDDIKNDAKWMPQPENARTWDNVVGGGNAAGADGRTMSCRWYPLSSDGRPVKDLKKIYEFVQGGTDFHLNMALWLRIKRDGDTVDMVPACLFDDKEQGLTSISPNAIRADENLRRYFMNVEGMGRHIMNFRLDATSGTISLKDIKGTTSLTLESKPKRVIVADPRYNHNPNNWFKVADGTDLKTAWLDPNNNPFKSCDGDIFMSCSDQGYLQSIYELGFLPRLTNPPVKNDPVGANFGSLDDTITEFVDSFARTQQNGVMWNTYDIFDSNGDAKVMRELKYVSGLHGLKVNPYSDSMEILSAAFANTPADWAHASTNATMNSTCDMGADEFNKLHAWNAYNSGSTKLMWSDIQDLAYAYHDKVRSEGYDTGKWETAFEDLAWSTDSRKILDGIDSAGGNGEIDSRSSDLYSVDKKYLYGFWKDCFAVNQQLFLIFVRAEPMMMGGGVAGNAPPQLSTRAVALVWRDPEGRKSGSSNPGSTSSSREPPHGLRILFYHPLD